MPTRTSATRRKRPSSVPLRIALTELAELSASRTGDAAEPAADRVEAAMDRGRRPDAGPGDAEGRSERQRNAAPLRARHPGAVPGSGRHAGLDPGVRQDDRAGRSSTPASSRCISIAILLWIVLRRFGDVLLTLVPLLLAGLVTLEVCVLIGMPLNFANIIALPLLLGVGVAFKIYYIMAWRAGQTEPAAVEPDPGRDLERADHGDRVRQPLAFEPSRHLQHGQAAGAVAGEHHVRGGAVPAGADGQAPDRRRKRPGSRPRKLHKSEFVRPRTQRRGGSIAVLFC